MVVFMFDLMHLKGYLQCFCLILCPMLSCLGGVNVEFWLDVEFLAQKPPRWNRQKRTSWGWLAGKRCLLELDIA